MGAAIQTMSEVRNFGTTRYLSSANGVLPGRSTFTAQVVLRLLGLVPTTAQFIAGNAKNSAGWYLIRNPDTNEGATANFAFVVYEAGAAQTLAFDMPMVIGLEMVITCQYVGGTPGVQRVWVNAVPAAFQTTTNSALSASSGAFCIGYEANSGAFPAGELGFFGFGFTSAALTQTEVEENYSATLKAQDITNAGLNVAWTNVYSTARSCGDGVADTWLNYGTASATQTLTATGRASLVLGTPAAAWSGGLVATGGSGPGINVTDVYLSALVGTDVNDGLTPATPVATWGRVWELLPPIQTDRFVVHVDGGSSATLTTTYTWVTPPVNTQIGNSAFIVIYGDGGGQGTHDGFFQVTTGKTAAAGCTDATLVVTGGGLAVNAYQDMFVQMQAGPAAGQIKAIIENDATTIYPVTTFADCTGSALAPAAGNAFRVVRPNVVLDFVTDQTFAHPGTRIHVVNAAFNNSAPQLGGLVASEIDTLWFGVEFRSAGAANIAVENVNIYSGLANVFDSNVARGYTPVFAQQVVPYLLAALGQPVTNDSGAWHGWGVTYRSALTWLFAKAEPQNPRTFSGFISGALHCWAQGMGTSFNLMGFRVGSFLADTNGVITCDAYGLNFVSGNPIRCRIDSSIGWQPFQFQYGGTILYGGTGGDASLVVTSTSADIFYGYGTGSCTMFSDSAIAVPATYNLFALSSGVTLYFQFGTCTVTAAGGGAANFGTIDQASVFVEDTLTATLRNGLSLVGGAKFSNIGTLNLTATADAVLTLDGASNFYTSQTCTLTGSIAGDAAVRVTNGSVFVNGNALTFRNNSAGAAAHSLSVKANASAFLTSTTLATTAGGAGSYGANLVAHGALVFDSSPGAGWTGNIANNAYLIGGTSTTRGAVTTTAVIAADASLVVYEN